MRRFICVLAFLAASHPLTASDDDVAKELKALQGKWKAVALEAGGNLLPKEGVPDFTYIIGGDGKATGKMTNNEYTATLVVDPKTNPKSLDNVHESGSQKGKKQFGVYKLEGDKLTVCITAPGAKEGDRPKDFTTKDTTNVIFVFERVKDGKKP